MTGRIWSIWQMHRAGLATSPVCLFCDKEEGTFDLADVATEIHGKMVRRHPHIFNRDPGTPMPTKEELAEQWKAIKAAEGNQA